VTTMDIELVDAALNAPTGLDGLAADMADLAGRRPTSDRHAQPSNPVAPRAAQYWRRLRDARVIIERVNALAGNWEKMGRLCVAARARRRSGPGSSGGGFIWHVRGHELFIGLKQSRNGCRSGVRRG
jgi:hypothetical protein